MAEASAITEEMKKLMDIEVGPKVYEVEKGMIKKFAEAIEDANPLWQEEKHANKSSYGSIVAPPTFLACFRLQELSDLVVTVKSPLTRILNGGTELEFFQPIRVGDIISVTGKVVDIQERENKSGKMVVTVLELICKNRDEEVARVRNTVVRY